MTATHYVINFGDDSERFARDMADQCDDLHVSYRLTKDNKMILAPEAVASLRLLDENTNGVIGRDEAGELTCWVWGCAFPVSEG